MKEKHPCHGDYLERFVQPAILSILTEGPAHGYYILGQMEERGIASELDSTGLYRSLKKLEDGGKLTSEWETPEGEKPRKIYTITEKGYRCLSNWHRTLLAYKVHVENMAAVVDKALEGKEVE